MQQHSALVYIGAKKEEEEERGLELISRLFLEASSSSRLLLLLLPRGFVRSLDLFFEEELRLGSREEGEAPPRQKRG